MTLASINVKSGQKEGVSFYQVAGEISLANSPELYVLLEKNQSPCVLIDLSGVTYIDSSGLATLIQFYKNIKSRNGHLALSGLLPKIKNLFQITKLNSVFLIAETPDEGVTLLKKQSL